MSVLSTLSGFWTDVLSAVQSTKVTVEEGVKLVQTGLAAYHDVHSGGSATALESIQKNAPDMLPELAAIAEKIYPGAGALVEGGSVAFAAFAHLLAGAHRMTPEEERAWMDRASRTDSGGS